MKAAHSLGKIVLTLVLALSAVSATAQDAAPPSSTVPASLKNYNVGEKVRVNLQGGGHVTGTIVALDSSTIILSQPSKPDEAVAMSNIKSVRNRSSLASRFKTGPCIDPITLAIAAPFITVGYLSGH